jgi:hypothetical protein
LTGAQTGRVVSYETGAVNPFFVQTSPTAATAYYISSTTLLACGTICGNAIQGGGTLPTLDSRAATNENHRYFLDAFAINRVNAARVVTAINKQTGLSIAVESIAAVEHEWRTCVKLAIIENKSFKNENQQSREEPATNTHSTRFQIEKSNSKTRQQKKMFEKIYKVDLGLDRHTLPLSNVVSRYVILFDPYTLYNCN